MVLSSSLLLEHPVSAQHLSAASTPNLSRLHFCKAGVTFSCTKHQSAYLDGHFHQKSDDRFSQREGRQVTKVALTQVLIDLSDTFTSPA